MASPNAARGGAVAVPLEEALPRSRRLLRLASAWVYRISDTVSETAPSLRSEGGVVAGFFERAKAALKIGVQIGDATRGPLEEKFVHVGTPPAAYNLIRGETFRDSDLKALVKGVDLPALTTVTFTREPSNGHDRNAIVATVDGVVAGYLPAGLAAKMAPAADREGIASFQVVGVVRESGYANIGGFQIDVCPGERITRGPVLPSGPEYLPSESMPASAAQIEFLRRLIAECDPDIDVVDGPHGRESVRGGSRSELRGALDAAGLTDYRTAKAFKGMTKVEASVAIDSVKKYLKSL